VEEIQIWEAVAKIMQDTRIRKCNQNILFDADALLFRNKVGFSGRFDDTMSAANLVYPDFPKGLDFLTSIYTRIPYYKDEGKIWFKGMGTDINAFYRYSCQDSAVSIEIMDRLDNELDSKGHRETYERTMKVYPICAAMMARGVRADKTMLLKVKAELEHARDSKQELLNKMCGEELNVKSTKQKIEYFYTRKNISPYKKQGRPTTDEKAMVRLAKGTATRPPIPEAQIVVDITRLRSQLEKYMDIELDPDGRLRCQINPWGTTTGRFSTGKRLITNSGANMQNLSQDFKKFLFADEGYVLIELDKKQGELVVVAYSGGDAQMMKVVEEGKDAHAITGGLITGIEDVTLIKAEANALAHETNPDMLEEVRRRDFPNLIQHREEGGYLPRHMTVRQLGKKSNHGGNYGMGYRRCALEWEIPEYEAKRILPLYHQAYPGVERGFQDGIIRQLSSDRVVTNCFGRKRQFLNRIDWKNRNSKVFEQAFGFLPQSTIADLMLEGMIKIYEDVEPPMDKLEFLMQNHDSILLQYPIAASNPDDMAKAILKCCDYLNPTMKYSGREFQIENELKIGNCWGSLEEVTLGTSTRGLVKRLSEVLREL
jgi:DNA polymerase I-like protein with 3'-5' exonuclease and polymerase domains